MWVLDGVLFAIGTYRVRPLNSLADIFDAALQRNHLINQIFGNLSVFYEHGHINGQINGFAFNGDVFVL